MWQVVRNWLLDATFPQSCCGCGAFGNLLCSNCLNALHFQLKPTLHPTEATDLDSITIAAEYDSISKKLIQSYKYEAVCDISAVIGNLIGSYTHLPKLDLLTCVPLHPIKQNERGFNQSELIARFLSSKLQIPFAHTLQRTHQGMIQKRLQKKERWKNTHSVFQLVSSQQNLTGKRVGIVDDVFTTGATLQACARQLRRTGTAAVHGICFCHGH